MYNKSASIAFLSTIQMTALRSMSVVVLWALLLLLQVSSLRIEAYHAALYRRKTSSNLLPPRNRPVWLTSSRWTLHHDISSISHMSYPKAWCGRRWSESGKLFASSATSSSSSVPTVEEEQGQSPVQVIQIIPNHLLTKSELVEIITQWAEEQVRTGSAIKLQVSDCIYTVLCCGLTD